MRSFRWLLLTSSLLLPASLASAQDCPPNALGTARVLEVPFAQGPVGRTNYSQTLPLAPGEVVLTFDDGPMPRRTPAVLDALRAECVKATFFVVGTMVAAYPDILRRTAAEGHTIATHTWSHAYLNRTSSEVTQRDQINGGLLAARAVLGNANPSLSPFFRYPGLGNTRALDRYVSEQHLIPFSIDVDSEDWKRNTPAQVIDRVMGRLDALGRGIILLHDIQPRTVAILPELLRQLKANGYRVVHVTAAPEDTRLALNAAEPLRSQRMQVALGRLDQQQAVRLAARETGFDPSSIPPTAGVATSTMGRPPNLQVASAELDGPVLTQTLPRDTPVRAPISPRGSLGGMMVPSPISAPVLSVAAGSGREGLSGAAAGSGRGTAGSTSLGTVQSQPATIQAELRLASVASEAQLRSYPPATAPTVRMSATWVDPPERAPAVRGKPPTTPPSAAPELRLSTSARSAPLALTTAPSPVALEPAPTSRPAPVLIAALEPAPMPLATAAMLVQSSASSTTMPQSKTVTSVPTASSRPRSSIPDALLTTASIAANADRQTPEPRAHPASSRVPPAPTAGSEAVPDTARTGDGLAVARPAASPTEAPPAAEARPRGFVVLAVAPGAGAGFREITLQR